ncbi:MAG: prepilin-type N-terminal cleavage/methylation domain-containing protein [Candidatus Omnitrophica bacterium]|nr:prepilin-type N-terminal cleavage/methylation domain-containing protein [Candidatus Omnitrophota bacterium]
MKKGFTLLELLIVIIIVGVMATLGLTQYTAVVERSRGAEARQILGQLRSVCAALYMDGNNVSMCTDGNLGLGNAAGQIPNTLCNQSHFFRYIQTAVTQPDQISFQALRCTADGKSPQHTGGGTVTLVVDYGAGTATWNSPNGY